MPDFSRPRQKPKLLTNFGIPHELSQLRLLYLLAKRYSVLLVKQFTVCCLSYPHLTLSSLPPPFLATRDWVLVIFECCLAS